MGCGSSADQPTAVVPAPGGGGGGGGGAQAQQKVPPTPIHTLAVAPAQHQTQPSISLQQPLQPQQPLQIQQPLQQPQHHHQPSSSSAAPQSAVPPPGLASFRNSPQMGPSHVRAGSRLSVGEDDLPPVKSPRKMLNSSGTGAAAAAGGAQQGASSMMVSPENAPPGSQIPGLNYCNAEYFPTHMEQTWNHYARPPDYKLIDKAGLKLMAEDAVASFSDASRKYLTKEHPKWVEAKLDTKLQALRTQYIPGSKIEDSIVIATHYLAYELKFAAADGDGQNSGVSKPKFFLNFQRAHRLLFSFTGGQDITLERELLVQKLNKQGVERANKGLKSLTAKSSSTASSAAMLSSKAAKSTKASTRHKSSKRDSTARGSKVGQADGTNNMFGHLDFSSPAKNKEMAVSEEEITQAQQSASNK